MLSLGLTLCVYSSNHAIATRGVISCDFFRNILKGIEEPCDDKVNEGKNLLGLSRGLGLKGKMHSALYLL